MPGGALCPGILRYADMKNGQERIKIMTDIVIQGIGGRMGHVLCDMIAQREDCRVIAGIDLKDGEQNGIPVYDSLVAFDITMLGILTILAVCQQTGRCKREIATLKGVEQVRIPQLRLAMFIQKLLSSERIVLINEVRFDGGIVRVLRGDMLERCHTVHPEFSRRSAEMRSGRQVRQGLSLGSARCPHRRNGSALQAG